MIRFVSVVALLASIIGAQADYLLPGSRLYAGCQLGVSAKETNAVTSYVMGVVDGSAAELGSLHKSRICVPEGVNGDTLRTIVCMYVRQHPEKLNDTAASNVFASLQEAFPCHK